MCRIVFLSSMLLCTVIMAAASAVQVLVRCRSLFERLPHGRRPSFRRTHYTVPHYGPSLTLPRRNCAVSESKTYTLMQLETSVIRFRIHISLTTYCSLQSIINRGQILIYLLFSCFNETLFSILLISQKDW